MMELSVKCTNYQLSKNLEVRNELILESLPLIEQFAKRNRNMYIHYWNVEDTISMGVLCAIDCIESYNDQKKLTFEAYLYSKLKFKLIDELRSYGFIPRRVSQQGKHVNEALDILTQQLSRTPSDEELASFLNMDVNQLSLHYYEISMNYLMSIEEIAETTGDRFLEDTLTLSPEQLFSKKQDLEQLKKAITILNEREQILINLYYVEQYKFKEIGVVFEVSEARVCQMHAQALNKMKKYLKEIHCE